MNEYQRLLSAARYVIGQEEDPAFRRWQVSEVGGQAILQMRRLSDETGIPLSFLIALLADSLIQSVCEEE